MGLAGLGIVALAGTAKPYHPKDLKSLRVRPIVLRGSFASGTGHVRRLTCPEVIRAVARLTRTVLVPSDLISSVSNRLHQGLRRCLRLRMITNRDESCI